ncbi:MAG TPA: 2-dehydropantoate 2-reductase [Phycisphaerae bacterium]|nr:2-dehydropantoate 2-reductase [Phycisphaerae bacterium]
MPRTAKPGPFTHVAIIGPGAVGLCLAVRLAGAPAAPRVTLIDHDAARARRLSARPIQLRSRSGDAKADVPVRLAPDAPADLVILATKAHHARAAASSAAAWIGRAPLVTIQNGLGAGAEVADALPATTVVTGVTYLAANRLAEGEVCHVAGAVTHLGYEGRPADGTVERVAELLERSGLPARAEADMVPRVWGKLLVNAAINPVAALAGARNGEVAVRATLRAMAEAIALEGQAAATAAGIRLPYASAAEAAVETARQTADNRCSMLQDLEAGRTTEIEYLNGAIVRAAEAASVPVPVNRAVTALVRQVTAAQPGAPS